MEKNIVKLPMKSIYNIYDNGNCMDSKTSVKDIVEESIKESLISLKQQYKKMGIKLLDNDDLNYNAILPENWYIKNFNEIDTEYAVCDNNGKIRILMEFSPNKKNAKESYSYIAPRYSFNQIEITDINGDRLKPAKYYGVVYDSEEPIYKTEVKEAKDIFDVPTIVECQEYLNKHFPKWMDVDAYWD